MGRLSGRSELMSMEGRSLRQLYEGSQYDSDHSRWSVSEGDEQDPASLKEAKGTDGARQEDCPDERKQVGLH